jgi:hypothetical protein
MFRLFSFFFTKNRKPKEYYSLFIGETSLGDVCALFNNLPSEKIPVEGKIRFQQLSFGTSPHKARLILGYPDCRHKYEYEKLQHKIYTYSNIGKFRGLIANCHFFNNQLHYIQTCIRNPDAETIDKLTALFERRYGYKLKDINSSFALMNEKGEILFYNFNVHINLYHFSANQEIPELIRKECISMRSKQIASKLKEINILEEII